MSGSRRCCCGKAEGCEICETGFNQTIPQATWCNTTYTFTFPNALLPALRADYKLSDYEIRTEEVKGWCNGYFLDCGNCPNPVPPLAGYCEENAFYYFTALTSLTLYYDINEWDINTTTGQFATLNPNADPRSIYQYEIGDGIFSSVATYSDNTYPCCEHGLGCCGTPEDYKDFLSFVGTIPYLTGITYTRDAGFKATFRACGFNTNGTPRTVAPSSTGAIVFNTIDSGSPAFGVYFSQGVTYQNADPALIKKIMYIPVVRTIGGSSVPTTEECWTAYNATGTQTRSPRRLSCEAEDCRCESLLVVKVKNYFRAKSQQYVLNSNGTYFIQTTEPPIIDYAESTLWLYYYGCIDGYIYGDNSAPTDRTFVLDGGFLDYKGHKYGTFANPSRLSPKVSHLGGVTDFNGNSSWFSTQLFPNPDQLNIDNTFEEIIPTLCTQQTESSTSPVTQPRRYLAASYLINELQMPAQLIVSRL
jgi:hypothetical protein